MTHIKIGWKCPICLGKTDIASFKPYWNQPKIVKQTCPTCLSQWQIKLTKIQGIVSQGKDIDVAQTLIRIGTKATQKMIRTAVEEGKRLKEGKKKSFWARIFGR